MRFLYNSANHPVFYTMESLIMAVVASNLLLAVIGICLYSRKILRNTGYKILIVFLAMTVLRFALPVDLPFSIVVVLPKPVSDVLSLVHFPFMHIGNFKVTIGMILVLIWVSGAIYLFYHCIRRNKRRRRLLDMFGENITEEEPYASLMNMICRRHKKRNCFRLIRMKTSNVPMVYGIFNPYIIIPENFEAEESEWYYILDHEVSHYFHHDLILKFGIDLLAIIYWWNPFGRLFREQAGLLLEMQADASVIGGDKETAVKYLRCLFHARENTEKDDQSDEISEGVSLGFFSGDQTELERRFGLIIDSDKKRKRWGNVALFLLILGIYYLSYQFIFEAVYRPYNIDENVLQESAQFFPQENEIYAIENEDGTYSIYCKYPTFYNDFFIEQVDKLRDMDLVEEIYYLKKGQYREK